MNHKNRGQDPAVWDSQWENISPEKEIRKWDFYGLRPWILKYVPRYGKVIEAGCGSGRWVFYLSRLGINIEGYTHQLNYYYPVKGGIESIIVNMEKYIKNYREGKGMPLKLKIFTINLLWVTILLSVFLFITVLWVQILLIIIAIAVTIHIILIRPKIRKIKK